MNKISILKIEFQNTPVLISKNATQEVVPLSKLVIFRNINFSPIVAEQNVKLKCFIDTKDYPDTTLLKANGSFKIYSIIKFKENNVTTPSIDYVEDSVEQHDNSVIFRPVFDMFLTNFHCKDDCYGTTAWHMEFEER
ncbi:MAG: hypothetical protein LBB34_01620 [Holosporales bacterium]|nr:hypothetical protein [Holosporales bacterium]